MGKFYSLKNILKTDAVYYVIFGSIAAAITANFTKKTNPFGESDNQ